MKLTLCSNVLEIFIVTVNKHKFIKCLISQSTTPLRPEDLSTLNNCSMGADDAGIPKTFTAT